MNKIPTAEEFLDRPEFEPDKGIPFTDYHHGQVADVVPHIMIEFAKLHVQAALELASKVERSEVKNVYPLTNIK